MDPAGVRVVTAPGTVTVTLAFVACGVGLGAASGLVPGLHANNFALLLASVAADLPGPPTGIAAAMLAAGVVHTFLDVVPALALGVPDPAMAPTALPGHRLVIAGRGREALRLSAVGSLAAVALAVPLSVPIAGAMVELYPAVRAHLPLVLAAVVAFLVLTEPSRRAAIGGLVAFGLAAALGALTLDLSPAAPLSAGGMLAPLFAGLFGAPILLDALSGAGVPPQGDARIAAARRDVGLTAGAGSLAGAVVGFVPGVSAAIAAVLALPLVPGRADDRGFLVAASGANTSNAVFALVALLTLGTPRTGVTVALEEAGVPGSLPALVGVVVLSACAGFALVIAVGDPYLRLVGNANNAAVCFGVLGLLLALSWLFAGVVGVGALVVATAVGLVPPRIGTRRVHLMGVLIGPLMVGG